MKINPRHVRIFGLALLVFWGLQSHVVAQGCVPVKFMALSFGPDGVRELQPGQWNANLSFRYLYADEGWRGTDRWPEYATVVGNQITVRSFDLQITRALTQRLSATLTIPYVDGQTSNPAEHDRTRHAVRARGFGDLRLVATVSLFEPNPNRNGNLSIGVGLKAPTGKEAATARYFKPTGPQVLPVDISIQPGDGGWGFMLEAAGHRRLVGQVFGYASGYYLINPRESNSAYTHAPILGELRPLSVPDQYEARAGLATAIRPLSGLTVSVGARVSGMPAHDLVGGSDGFRRPGYVIYFDPGLSWSRGATNLSVFVPTRLDANRTRNVYEERMNTLGGGAFARRLFVVSYAFTY